jgi:hypothetical protein
VHWLGLAVFSPIFFLSPVGGTAGVGGVDTYMWYVVFFGELA